MLKRPHSSRMRPFLIGIAVSSGVAIYPMVREMFPVRIVATALTSLKKKKKGDRSIFDGNLKL